MAKPVSMSSMIGEMVNNLSCSDDERFQRFWNYKPLEITRDWWKGKAQTSGLVGANKSGKTTTEIVKDVMIFTGMVPPSLKDLYPHNIPLDRPRHVRIIVQDYTKALPELIWPLLVGEGDGMLPRMWASDYDPNQHIFWGPDIVNGEPRTGSFLSIIAVDPTKKTDPTTLRGPKIDHTHIVERTTREAYTESLTRSGGLKDGPCTVDLDWCPQDGKNTWERADVYGQVYDLQTDKKKAKSEQSKHFNIQRITIWDNPFVSDEYKLSLRASLKDYEIAYRMEGRYSDRADDPFFDQDQLYLWENAMVDTGEEMIIDIIEYDPEEGVIEAEFIEKPRGAKENGVPIWRVWEPPKKGEYYICVHDGADGRPKSDYNTVDIWRCSEDGLILPSKPTQVAQLHMRLIHPDKAAIQGICASNIYGDCLYVFERNNTCGGVILEKARYYDNVYKKPMPEKQIIDETERLGFYTDRWNKPSACQEAYNITQEWKKRYNGYCGIKSKATINDMIAFQDRIEKNDDGKEKRVLAARKGAFDDCVSAFYMMSYVLSFQKELLTECEVDATSSNHAEEPLSDFERDAAARGEKKSKFGILKKMPSIRNLTRGRNNDGRKKFGSTSRNSN